MKLAICRLLIWGLSALPLGFAWADQVSKAPEKLHVIMSLVPADDEIPGWPHSEKFLRASNEEELYKIFDGGASLSIQHGFHSYVGQSYRGPKGLELEVYIFDQGNSQHAKDLFENPLARPSRMKEIASLGEKARIDMTPLFCYGVEFIQKGFFVRVIV